MPRPGTRSKKQSKILQNRGSLGDTSSSDDRSVDRTTLPGRSANSHALQTRRLIGSSDSHFYTPEKENNATDYGFEFTTSNIQNPSPRRSSTLRPTSSQEEPKKSKQRTRNKSPTKNPARQMAAKEHDAEKQNTSRSKQKQTPSKGRKQQTEKSDSDNDDADSDENDYGDDDAYSDEDDDEEEDKENSFQRSKQKKEKKQLPRIGKSKARKQQNAEKEVTQRKTGKQLRQQRAKDREQEEESGNVGHSKANLTEGNRSDVSHAKKTKPSRRGTPKVVAPPAAKQRAQEPATSKASRQSTDKNQQNPKPNSAAVKKRRKQLNPVQKQTRFLRAVKALQNRTDNLIPRLPFSRVVREIMMKASSDVTQITFTAMEALQTSAEMYLTQRLQDSYMLTLHRGRVTLEVRDFELLNFLKEYL